MAAEGAARDDHHFATPDIRRWNRCDGDRYDVVQLLNRLENHSATQTKKATQG
jgi:hypothetical protein